MFYVGEGLTTETAPNGPRLVGLDKRRQSNRRCEETKSIERVKRVDRVSILAQGPDRRLTTKLGARRGRHSDPALWRPIWSLFSLRLPQTTCAIEPTRTWVRPRLESAPFVKMASHTGTAIVTTSCSPSHTTPLSLPPTNAHPSSINPHTTLTYHPSHTQSLYTSRRQPDLAGTRCPQSADFRQPFNDRGRSVYLRFS